MKYKVTVKNTGSDMEVILKIEHNGKKFKYSDKGDTLKNITENGDRVEKAINNAFGKKDAKKIIKRIVKDFD